MGEDSMVRERVAAKHMEDQGSHIDRRSGGVPEPPGARNVRGFLQDLAL